MVKRGKNGREQADLGRRIRLIHIFRDPLGIGAGGHQIRRGQKGASPVFAVAKSARIGQDGRIEAGRHLPCHRESHMRDEPADQLPRGTRLRIDQPDLAESPVGDVVIDVDQVGDGGNPFRLFPDSLQFAAIQNEGGLEGFEGGKFMDDPVAPREKLIILRRPVLIVDRRLFSQLSQHMVKGQFRTEGIPVEPLVGRDQKNPVPADQIANPAGAFVSSSRWISMSRVSMRLP